MTTSHTDISPVDSSELRRLCALALLLLLMAVGGVFIYRAASLNGLPTIPEPVDVASVESLRVPDDENAFTFYAQAVKRLVPEEAGDPSDITWAVREGWHSVNPSQRRWLEANRQALSFWRQGTEHHQAQDRQPSETSLSPKLRKFAQLALMEAARLENRGDHGGAWEWYHALLRSSRHVGQNSGWEGRRIGAELYAAASSRATSWARHGKVTSTMLHDALYDLQQLESMTPKPSETFGFEYVRLLRILNDGSNELNTVDQDDPSRLRGRVDHFLGNEPERSRRVLRLIFANWLAECDLPPSQRPDPKLVEPALFEDPDAPASAQRLSPETLMNWYRSSELSNVDLPDFALCDLAARRNVRSITDWSST